MYPWRSTVNLISEVIKFIARNYTRWKCITLGSDLRPDAVPPSKKGASRQKNSGGGTLNAITQDEIIRFALDSEDHHLNDIDVHVPVKVHSKLNLRGDKFHRKLNLRGDNLIIITRNYTVILP